MIRLFAAALAAAAVLTAAPLAPAPASAQTTATLRVSASTELTEGQRITVDGSGFRAGLAAVAVGLCKKGFTSGIKDCDLEGGATFVNISDDGTFPTVTLSARARFRDIDCATRECVIAAAPLPGSEPPAVIAANSAEIPVRFAGSALPAPAAVPAASAPAAAGDVSGPSLPLWAATAVLLAVVAAVALADRRRL
ncbi:neocarzinostatin apoprotein domain-containing protein [Nocardia sp. NPDC048505]|uniref:neocarzinostatin apoprotein domain-containing protein n=1 Tax=unclassified Nocardia TaxID=2637762 RepID=UPI0033CAD54E